jgi:DNA-binding winged helix-turn-helix (wHTH) protein
MTELQQLRDRVAELEEILGIDRPMTVRLREAFGLTQMPAKVLGMLLSRTFVSKDALYTALYAVRAAADRPRTNILERHVNKLREHLRPHGVVIETIYGEGYRMTAPNKAKVRDVLDKLPSPDAIDEMLGTINVMALQTIRKVGAAY